MVWFMCSKEYSSRNALSGASAHLGSLVVRFAKAENGQAAVEFALVAVPFLGLLFAIIESMMVMFGGVALESGMQQASRLIRTGQAQVANMSESEFRTALCDSVGSVFRCSERLIVDVRSYENFDEINFENPLSESGEFVLVPQFEPGGAGEVVLVRAFFKWDLLTPVFGSYLSNMSSDERLIASAAVFRNEPFGSLLGS